MSAVAISTMLRDSCARPLAQDDLRMIDWELSSGRELTLMAPVTVAGDWQRVYHVTIKMFWHEFAEPERGIHLTLPTGGVPPADLALVQALIHRAGEIAADAEGRLIEPASEEATA